MNCFTKLYLVVLLFFVTGCTTRSSTTVDVNSFVSVAGAMRNVMWKGELQGTISLDTLCGKPHLYGVGPLDSLSGELMLLDSKVYVSRINNNQLAVETDSAVKAPFFVYAQVPEWREVLLPDSVRSLSMLEKFLTIHVLSSGAFPFRLQGNITKAKIHILNLPSNTVVNSPEQAHKGQVNVSVTNQPVEVVGFFSRLHKGIFTHHDSFVHLHLLTADHQQMGHVDDFRFDPRQLKLFLPD